MTEQFVYLLKPKHANVYKIGQTVNLEKRIKTISRKFNFELEYAATKKVENSYQVEQYLHLKFLKYHLGGDWFALDPMAISTVIRFFGELK